MYGMARLATPVRSLPPLWCVIAALVSSTLVLLVGLIGFRRLLGYRE